MENRYVSRGGLKLESVSVKLGLNFKDKIVLDVGSSTGGFTDFALQHGAQKVIAVDSGAKQMHPKLRFDDRIELHEKTDIRAIKKLSQNPDLVIIDVSFISLRQVLPAIANLVPKSAHIIAMVKPQFESKSSLKHQGVIKNDRLRREVLRDFEVWVKKQFVVLDKADSGIRGATGNLERFYLLRKHK